MSTSALTPSSKLPVTQKGRMSALPLSAYLTIKISESGKTNTEIANELGYDRPNVIAMMKTGSMRLPLNRVGLMAKALGIDPVFLLEKVMTETNPDLWEAMRPIIGTSLVSENELKFIQLLRGKLNGVDADFTAYKEFIDVVKEQLTVIKKREVAGAQASIDRLERERAAKKKAA